MPKPKPDLQHYISDLRLVLEVNGIRPNTVKASLCEHSFIQGIASASGGTAALPPAMVICALAGRSILTLQPQRAEGEGEEPSTSEESTS